MIEVSNLRKSFGETKALDGVDFTVNKGEVLGVLGPNGAGKTTALRIITSFWPSDGGDVRVDGKDVARHPIATRKRIGYLPEIPPLYEEMKAREYLKFAAEVRGVPRKEIPAKIRKAAEICGAKEVLRRPIEDLSKGYKQRIGLAQAILHEPDILILDEPTVGLDPNQIVEIRDLIKEIGREKTVLFSTHILGEARATCDRLLILHEGAVRAVGTPEEVIEKVKPKEVIYIKVKGFRDQVLRKLQEMKGVAEVNVKDEESDRIYGYEIRPEKDLNIDLREHLTRAIPHWGWSILELSKKEVSLEEVFRELTK